MTSALELFADEVRRADAELDLGRAALLLALGEYPDLSLGTCLDLLDEVAAGVRALLPPDATEQTIAHAVRRRLFHDLEFSVNEADFYDPRNSYLNEVLIRRLGIPISLSVIFIEVARRAGLTVEGVSFPQRFLLKYHADGQEWIVDPVLHGEEFSGEHFRAHLATSSSAPAHMVDYHLSAASKRQTLSRMLLNLKHIYGQREDYARALRIQEYRLAITPWAFEEIRDRGVIRARLNDRAGALTDLETYLDHAGPAEDVSAMRDLVKRLRGS